MVDFRKLEALSFDCYGTLIDWESGILGAMRPVALGHGLAIDDEALLALYARAEPLAEHGDFVPYRVVLERTMLRVADELGITLAPEEQLALVQSLPEWRPFPDTVAALRTLKNHYRLVIVSNVDEDLFAHSAARLEVPFDAVVTAESVGAYKPARAMFDAATERIGCPAERWLHVAQSLFHDVAPAKELGIACAHVDRRAGRAGSGATPESSAVPDLTVPDLASLAKLAEEAFAA